LTFVASPVKCGQVGDRFIKHSAASARRQRPKNTADPVAWIARGAADDQDSLASGRGLPIALKLTSLAKADFFSKLLDYLSDSCKHWL
jgi:hypothetical protein